MYLPRSPTPARAIVWGWVVGIGALAGHVRRRRRSGVAGK